MVRPKSKVDMLKPVEALQHQSARNQESHRDRNLRDDETIKPSAAGRANADSLIALLKTRHHVALDRKSTRLNSSHPSISYAVFCLKKKKLGADEGPPQTNKPEHNGAT